MVNLVKLRSFGLAVSLVLLSFSTPANAKTDPQPKPKPNKVSRVRIDTTPAKSFAQSFMLENYAWDQEQFVCLESLWNMESGWNHRAHNRSSGAYGIPQSLPGHKMKSAGSDWRTNPQTQIRWGLSYIKQRYSDPCGAWNHFQRKNWY